eukprot:5715950-Pleurochrysis_carterae.AAC.1
MESSSSESHVVDDVDSIDEGDQQHGEEGGDDTSDQTGGNNTDSTAHGSSAATDKRNSVDITRTRRGRYD